MIESEPPSRQQQALEQCERWRRNLARRATRYKLYYRALQSISLVLAVATTVLSTLVASHRLTRAEWVVPMVSGLAVLATTFLTQTNAQRRWIHTRGVAQKLQAEQFLYEQGGGHYARVNDEDDRLKLFATRILLIWSQAQSGWVQQVASGGGQ